LQAYDHGSLQEAWLSEVQEDNEMESFIVCLFDEVVDPSVVPLHGSETSQVSAHSTDHTGNTGNSLQEHAPADPFLLSHMVGVVSGEVVV